MKTQAFRDEAQVIAQRLVKSAIRHGDRATWLNARREVGVHGGGLAEALDPYLHVGTSGVAVFLARYAALERDDRAMEIAECGIRQALRASRYSEEHNPWDPNPLNPAGRWRAGFYLGQVGILWGAYEVSALGGDSGIAREAQAQLRDIATAPNLGHEFDLMFGAAGGIVGALTLADAQWPDADKLALRLGTSLVENAFVRGDTYSWGPEANDSKRPNWTGISHGASGPGYALARLFSKTGDPAFEEAALGAFAYERAVFEKGKGNWLDYSAKPDAEGNYPSKCTWCHGAPGIGLARAAASAYIKDPRITDDLRAAHKLATERLKAGLLPSGELFMLCCGNGGILECVWEMDKALGAPNADQRARKIASVALEQYGAAVSSTGNGWMDWPTGPPKSAIPGLVQGLAGIGNLLLRLSGADVPSAIIPGASRIGTGA